MANLPVDRQIEILGKELEGPLRKQIIREMSQKAFGEARAHNRSVLGYAPRESLATDGVEGKLPEEMKVGGRAVLTFGVQDGGSLLAAFAIAELQKVSPRGRSNSKAEAERYAANHIVIVDGRVAEPPYLLPQGWNQIIITNVLPYARKIERGLSSQRPDGVYEAIVLPRTKEWVRSNGFASLYSVTFTYKQGLAVPFGKKSYRYGPLKNRRKKISNEARSALPAIIVES